MTSIEVKLTFEKGLIKTPTIYELTQKYDLISNIIKANVEENMGWVILELVGPSETIDQGLSWVANQGIIIEVVEVV